MEHYILLLTGNQNSPQTHATGQKGCLNKQRNVCATVKKTMNSFFWQYIKMREGKRARKGSQARNQTLVA